MEFLGVERILDGIRARTYGCLNCGGCEFIPAPRQDFFYWCDGKVKIKGNTIECSEIKKIMK
jgi:hypothetical protein